MKIIEQSAEVLAASTDALQLIEVCGRTAYKSEDVTNEESAGPFVAGIVKRNHLAVIEHASMTVRFITDRGVSHEIVRHRIASFTQESTRYCNYSKSKFGAELTFIKPVWVQEDPSYAHTWLGAMENAERAYLLMLKEGAAPQEARSVLPNSLKTEVVVTANMREWRHILQLRRIEKAAHPQMRALMAPLYTFCRSRWPELFNLGEPE